MKPYLLLALALGVFAPTAHGGCKIKWKGHKSYLKCTGDIAKAAGAVTGAAQGVAEAVIEKPAEPAAQI